MAAGWSEKELKIVRANLGKATDEEIAALLPSRSAKAVKHCRLTLAKERNADELKQAREAALNPPVEIDKDAHIRKVEEENARLRQQITWAQHADAKNRTGGVLTLRASDHHYGDANHLLSCGLSLEAKSIEVCKQYQPDRINIVAGDDWIAGNGIFKEQEQESVTSSAIEQCQIGAMHARRWLLKIRSEGIRAPISWHIMRGNHDYAKGQSMTEYLLLLMEKVCSDIPKLKFVMHWDRNILNLAHKGSYYALIRHGMGHSNTSPNSPAFVNSVMQEILIEQRRNPDKPIYRVVSGHTHWASIGLERIVGLEFDTTGGLQRNKRTKLGSNQRPSGWIVYVSTRGMKDNILLPILLKPEEDVYMREIASAVLEQENRADAAERLKEFRDLMENKGTYAKNEGAGPKECRW
jgi:hypothetical protein